MHIKVEVSVFVLSHPELLKPLAAFLAEPDDPWQVESKRLEQKLTDVLKHALKRKFGTYPLEQLKRRLEQLPSHYRAHQQKPVPLVMGALATLTERYLQWGPDRVELNPQHLLELQVHLERLMPDQLSLYALRLHALPQDAPDGSPRPSNPELLHKAFQMSPLLPPPGFHALPHWLELGLVETHRHDALSRLPILRWAELMQDPSKLERKLHEKARQEGTGWLDKCWVEDISHRRLLQLVRWAARLRALLSRTWSSTDTAPATTGAEPSSPNQRLEALLLEHGRYLRELEHPPPLEEPFLPGGPPYVDDTPDPASRLPGGEVRPLYSERAFLCELLRRLGMADLLAHHQALMHAYLLIQNLAVQFWIQSRHSEEGLERFVQDYAQSPLQDLESSQRHDPLIQAWRTGAVRWLELRLAPNAHAPEKLEQKMRGLLQGAVKIRPRGSAPPSLQATLLEPSSSTPRIDLEDLRLPSEDPDLARPGLGFIIHFLKKKDPEQKQEDAAPFRLLCRHHQRRLELEKEREQVARLLENPTLAPYIVGLDVANLETYSPVEVFVPTLLSLRQPYPLIPSELERWTARRDPLERPPLRLTCHAGEAFDHLLTGMRTVDESLHFLEMRPGDRLGHALAMGLEPPLWLQRVGDSVRMRRGEALDNLVWFYHKLELLGPFGGLCRQLLREIQRLSRLVYGKTLELDLLQRAWEWRAQDPLSLHLLFSEPGKLSGLSDELQEALMWTQRLPEVRMLDSLLAPRFTAIQHRRLTQAREALGDDALLLWLRYHYDPTVRKRSEEFDDAEAGQTWEEAYRTVQDQLIQYCRTKGVIVEINPSSNLCIGPLRDLSEHPVFRWRGPGMTLEEGCQVVVGSDDPSVFGAELLHEYGFLWAAAQARGHSLLETERWLESLRHAGQRYSFIPYTLSNRRGGGTTGAPER